MSQRFGSRPPPDPAAAVDSVRTVGDRIVANIDQVIDGKHDTVRIGVAVLLGLYECREDTDERMLLVRMGLPGAADDLARTVYEKVRPLHLSLPPLADECPEWARYEESWMP